LLQEWEGEKEREGEEGGRKVRWNSMLWKYNVKQAWKFPENMGIELNTREEFLPQKECSRTNILFIIGFHFFYCILHFLFL